MTQLSKVRDQLGPVNLILIDKISMVSYTGFYNLSAQLSNTFNLSLEAFARKNIIVADDFAQLPPPGMRQSALYSSNVSLHASGQTLRGQKNALGRALWHTFTTVIIL